MITVENHGDENGLYRFFFVFCAFFYLSLAGYLHETNDRTRRQNSAYGGIPESASTDNAAKSANDNSAGNPLTPKDSSSCDDHLTAANI